MTTKERVLATLNHQEPDRVPTWTMVDNSDIYRHFAPDGFDFSTLINTEDPFPPAFHGLYKKTFEALGIDVTFCHLNPFPREKIEGRTHWRQTPFKDVSDVVAYEPRIPSYEDLVDGYVKSFREVQKVLEPHTMYIMQGTTAIQYYNVFGLELFSIAMYEAPEAITRILDAYSEGHRIQAQIYATHRLGPVYQVSCDVGDKNGTLFSPVYLRKEFVPRLKREIEPLKEAGIKVIVHSDGNITGIVDDLVDIGVDGINPLETSASMDLGLMKKRYGKNLVLIGNVDSANILPFGTPRDVEQDVKRCIREGAAGGGYFLDTGAAEIMPDVSVENILSMFDAVKKYGRYPISVD
jgi:uroporphyrinogen decarboxylase